MKKCNILKKVVGVIITLILVVVSVSTNTNTVIAQNNNFKLMQTAEETLPFPITLRDFKADYVLFEPSSSMIPWLGQGMVADEIGEERKPVFNESIIKTLADNLWKNRNHISNMSVVLEGLGNINDAKTFYENNLEKEYNLISPTNEQLDTRINTAYRYIYYHLNKLFTDTNGLSIQGSNVIKELILTKNNDGTYSYDSDKDSINKGFFPFDGKGFGNENRTHNYHFTLESHTKFWFEKGKELTFNFTGDDDVWVYINGKLVIDLGGIHGAQSQSITIKENGEVYNKQLNKVITTLPKSGWYNFDFFYMERHTTESNLKITTNMEFKPDQGISKEAYILNNGEFEPANTVYPGETIYYKLGMKNSGNVDLKDIEFTDEKLGIKINQNGVYKNNQLYEYEDLTITKKNNAGEVIDENILNQLEKLKTLGTGESILIESEDFLKYQVTDSDAKEGKVLNKAIGSAIYEGETIPKESETSVEVEAKDIPNEEQPIANIEKRIHEIKRDGTVIYPNQDNIVPMLEPGDKVKFKFIINNETISPNTGEALPLGSLSLEDVLSPEVYEKKDWTFYNGTNEFNVTDFTLQPKLEGDVAELELTTSEWTVPEPREDWSYDVKNTVTLYRTISDKYKLDDSSVELSIARPSLKITKVIDGEYDNSEFSISIEGSDDTLYNVRLKKDEVATLNNLKYGVTYTITELPTINYKLVGIGDSSLTANNGNYSYDVEMTKSKDNSQVVVKNSISNKKWFSHKYTLTNTLKYELLSNTKKK